jgi:hypothetical protein
MEPVSATEKVVVRLFLSAKRPIKGLSYVVYSYKGIKQQITGGLAQKCKEEFIPFYDVTLPKNKPFDATIHYIYREITGKLDGVVSISGIETAISDRQLDEALASLNFHRDNIVGDASVRQIWWIPDAIAKNALTNMPDFLSFCSPRIYL